MDSLDDIFDEIYLLTKKMMDSINDESALNDLIDQRDVLTREYENLYNSSVEKPRDKFPDKVRLEEIVAINKFIITKLEEAKEKTYSNLVSVANRQKDLNNRIEADRQRYVKPGTLMDSRS